MESENLTKKQIYQRTYYQNNKEILKQKRKIYYNKNKGNIKQKQKKYQHEYYLYKKKGIKYDDNLKKEPVNNIVEF